MYEATLRVEPGGPYGEPTVGTDVVVELWCNEHCDMLDVRGRTDGGVFAAIEEQVGVRDHSVDGERTVIVTEQCLKSQRRTLERHIARHSCLLVPPLRYAEGAKFCRILGLDPDDLTSVYRDLQEQGTVEVVAKRAIDAPSADDHLLVRESLVPALSDRQRDALLAAHERGYYEIPRETTTAEIADELGVSRRTAEDHLRRAEKKLVSALVDLVRLASGRPSRGG